MFFRVEKMEEENIKNNKIKFELLYLFFYFYIFIIKDVMNN